jgi:catechol 2,3-dioxygenase-like lactoylglutathione lyase family enzyme
MLPLSQTRVTTNLPVKDMGRARAFYEGKLGLSDAEPRPGDGSVVYHLQGADIALMPREEGTKADHTALMFEVPDIQDGVRTLEKAGVTFEDYDTPEFRTVGHIFEAEGEKCAWFRDTEGNYLCLHQSRH